MKVVTVETLRQAMADAQSGMDVNTTDAQYRRMVFDALPTAPLAEDVQAAIRNAEVLAGALVHLGGESSDAQPLADGGAHIRTIIAALHAATADRERLRAALERWGDCGPECSTKVLTIPPSTSVAEWPEDYKARIEALAVCTCGFEAAIADTPAPDVVVVPRPEWDMALFHVHGLVSSAEHLGIFGEPLDAAKAFAEQRPQRDRWMLVERAEYERLKRMEERAIEVGVRLRKYTPGWDEVSYILHEEVTDARPAAGHAGGGEQGGD